MTRLSLAFAALWTVAMLSATSSAQQNPHRGSLSDRAVALFTTSDDCVACHNNLITPAGEDVSIGVMWRSTMMGNSARDPYFHAAVRRELMDHPSLAAEIQDECAGCHLPMLQRAAHADGKKADILSQLPIRADDSNRDHRLAADSVSCTVCHQISNRGLGTRANFNGRFTLEPPDAADRRAILGPYSVDAGRARVMHSVTDFTQVEAPHIRESAVCATCHTLYTQAHAANGDVVGELPEQMNFQEWQHSAFNAERRSCQSCHMPDVPQPMRVASVLGEQREGFSRHLFVGGNFFVLRMLNRFREELGVEALSSELEATTRATLRQLETETASVAVRFTRAAATVVADVSVNNLTGHKLPTGYPSRRAWLHVVARDRQGQVVFESGRIGPDGAIAGNDNDAAPDAFEPHYDEIRRPDEVQIYESIMAAPGDVVTTGLLQATHYAKDNRLLPRGFDKATAPADIAVHGAALADATFAAGGDQLRYLLPATATIVDVELRYQPIAFRWAQNLRRYDAPEPKRFGGYYAEMAPAASTVVARQTVRIE
jgi:hypothetical protein